MAAAEAAVSATATAKSGRPLGLIPALTAAKRKPRGRAWEEIKDESDMCGFYSIRRGEKRFA
jgi:hypothetical protein